MPTNTLVSRMGSEVFSILGPGFYILSGMILVGSTNQKQAIFEFEFGLLSPAINNWPNLFVLFLLAYMIGMLIRSIPVRFSDSISKFCFGKIPFKYLSKKNQRLGYFFSKRFPYPSILLDYRKKFSWDIPIPHYFGEFEDDFEKKKSGELESEDKSRKKDETKSEIQKEEYWVIESYFNFLKLMLCQNSPNIYLTIQPFESRVRLASGMFWAGVAGLGAVFIVPFTLDISSPAILSEPLIFAYFTFSLVVVLLFGFQIPQLRGQEAVHVYLAYVAYLQSET